MARVIRLGVARLIASCAIGRMAAGSLRPTARGCACRAIAGALVLLAHAPASPGDAPGAPRVEVVATGLEAPWALAFDPAGDLFITERPGRIRKIQKSQLLSAPLAALNVAAIGEAGLMGLALDPAFDRNGFLYVCYTTRKEERPVNRVARLTVHAQQAGAETHPAR